jgi:hypothetical protein
MAFGVAENQAALVTHDRRRARAGDRAVRNGGLDIDGIDDVAESGAEDHANGRRETAPGADIGGGFIEVVRQRARHGGGVYATCELR